MRPRRAVPAPASGATRCSRQAKDLGPARRAGLRQAVRPGVARGTSTVAMRARGGGCARSPADPTGSFCTLRRIRGRPRRPRRSASIADAPRESTLWTRASRLCDERPRIGSAAPDAHRLGGPRRAADGGGASPTASATACVEALANAASERRRRTEHMRGVAEAARRPTTPCTRRCEASGALARKRSSGLARRTTAPRRPLRGRARQRIEQFLRSRRPRRIRPRPHMASWSARRRPRERSRCARRLATRRRAHVRVPGRRGRRMLEALGRLREPVHCPNFLRRAPTNRARATSSGFARGANRLRRRRARRLARARSARRAGRRRGPRTAHATASCMRHQARQRARRGHLAAPPACSTSGRAPDRRGVAAAHRAAGRRSARCRDAAIRARGSAVRGDDRSAR